MQNIQTLQDLIASYDFTSLSQTSQTIVMNQLSEIVNIVLKDFISNSATTSDQITSVMTAISTARRAALQTSQASL